MLDDLPPDQAADERCADHHERHQDDQEAAARVGPSQHRSLDRLAWRHDEGLGQLVESEVDRQLADGRPATEPVEVGDQLIAASDELRALVRQPVDLVAGGRDADALDQREECQQEGQRDPAEQDPDRPGRRRARTVVRARRRGSVGVSTIRGGRKVGRARTPCRTATSRPPRSSAAARRGRGTDEQAPCSASTARDRARRRRRGGRVRSARAARAGGGRRTAATGLVALAHRVLLLSWRWVGSGPGSVRRSGRALRGDPLGGSQPGAAGAGVGGDLGRAAVSERVSRRRRGMRPQTQTGHRGGQIQPLRSAP